LSPFNDDKAISCCNAQVNHILALSLPIAAV
jgi:hypothetical protein